MCRTSFQSPPKQRGNVNSFSFPPPKKNYENAYRSFKKSKKPNAYLSLLIFLVGTQQPKMVHQQWQHQPATGGSKPELVGGFGSWQLRKRDSFSSVLRRTFKEDLLKLTVKFDIIKKIFCYYTSCPTRQYSKAMTGSSNKQTHNFYLFVTHGEEINCIINKRGRICMMSAFSVLKSLYVRMSFLP